MSSTTLLLLMYGFPEGGPFTFLAKSARFADVEKQLQLALWIAGGLSIVVFIIALFFGRRRLESNDKLSVDWGREEARMRSLADLKKATRSPEEQRRLAATQPADRVQGGVAAQVASPLLPDASATGSGNAHRAESDVDQLMRGLSD